MTAQKRDLKITQEQLDESITLHGLWLKGESGGECMILEFALLNELIVPPGTDLRGAVFYEVDLYLCKMRGVDLSESAFYDSQLSSSEFNESNMRSVRFQDCHSIESSFERVDLRGAMMANSTFIECSLNSSDLSDLRISLGRGKGEKVSSVGNLLESDYRDHSFSPTVFEKCVLSGANLSGLGSTCVDLPAVKLLYCFFYGRDGPATVDGMMWRGLIVSRSGNSSDWREVTFSLISRNCPGVILR